LGRNESLAKVGLIYSIAGVAMKVDTGPLKLPSDSWAHWVCRRFCLNGSGVGGRELDVRLTADPAPVVTGYKRVFDSQDSWSIYSDGQDLFIIDQYPPYARPVWTARLCMNSGRVTLYCDEAIIDPVSQTLAFNPIAYPLDQILLMHYLADHEGGILHAAGWALNDRGWVFAGKSGAGKSTLARRIDEGAGGDILSDDRIVIRGTGKTYTMFGTPWPGEGRFAVNRGVNLERLIFLTRGNGNRITEITPSAAVSRLLPVLSVPWYDEQKVDSMMGFCENLLRWIPAYEFSFLPDLSAVNFLKEVALG
jgi:hypothetical protein